MKKNFFGPFFVASCMFLRSTDVFFRSHLLSLLSPFLLITLEHFIGALFFIKKIKLIKKIWTIPIDSLFMLIFIICGSSVGGIFFFSKAFTIMNPAVVILLQKLQPVLSTFLSLFLLGEKPSKIFWPFAVLALFSSYILTFNLTFPWKIMDSFVWKGALYTFASVFFWGGGTVIGKKLLGEFDYLELTCLRYFGGFLFSIIILVLFLFGDLTLLLNLSLPQIPILLYTALIPGVLALYLFYHGLRFLTAIQASFLELIFPISSTLIAWFFLAKPLGTIEIIAGSSLLLSITFMSVTKAVK